jgi:hypothetical protein
VATAALGCPAERSEAASSQCQQFARDYGTTNDNPPFQRFYCEVWKSMFSSTESCAGVPEASSPDRVATTRKPLALV